MTKTTATVMLIIFIAVLAFVGVFTFIPDFEYGAYGEFHSPATLIQKSNLFSDTLTTNYSVDLGEDATEAQVKKIINKRLTSIYGIYGADISINEGILTVTIPEIADTSDGLAADSVMEAVSVSGVLEIVTETTYAEDKVVLSAEHFKSASTRKLVSQGQEYYVAIVNLTKDGAKAAKSLSTIYAAVDGTVAYGAQLYTENTLYLFGSSMMNAKEIASYVNGGALNAELNLIDSATTDSAAGMYLLIGMAVVMLALAVFYVVRYKALGWVAVLSQLFTIVVATIVAGLIHLEILNVFGIIGILLGIALQTYFTVYAFDNISAYEGSTFASAKHKGFAKSNKLNLIVHAIALVVGIILWVIPTIVTAPLGNVLVYLTVLSFVATMGLNRLLAQIFEPFIEGAKSNRK